jgi:hypothetical protein
LSVLADCASGLLWTFLHPISSDLPPILGVPLVQGGAEVHKRPKGAIFIANKINDLRVVGSSGFVSTLGKRESQPYLTKLLANGAVKSYIGRHEPEILTHLELVVNTVSMEEAVQQQQHADATEPAAHAVPM